MASKPLMKMNARLSLLLAGLLLALLLAAGGAPARAAGSTAVVVWGDNLHGQLNVPAGLDDAIAVDAGAAHIVAVKSDGTVAAWGFNSYGETNVPTGLNSVTDVSTHLHHNLALKNDGTVVAWGLNSNGQSTVPTDLGVVVDVAAGASHSLALKRDGTVVAWGWDGCGQSTVPGDLSDVKAVAAGYCYSLALKNDGILVGWGSVDGGTGVLLSNVKEVSAGYNHWLALLNDGTVVVQGSNDRGQLNVPDDLTDVVAIEAGSWHNLVLKSDGSVVAWGGNSFFQTDVPPGLRGVLDLGGGFQNSVALYVPNAAPSASAGDDVAGAEGSAIALNGSAADPDNDPLTYAWTSSVDAADPGATCTFGDAAAAATTIICNDDGTFTATLTVDDGVNPPVNDSAKVTVANADPIIDSLTPSTTDQVPLGNAVLLTVAFSDAGSNDTHTTTFNWGDGTTNTESSHTYAAGGVYTVVVTVTDDDGGGDTESYAFFTVNAPPTVNAGGDVSGAEGSAIALAGSATDPDNDSLTYAWTYSIDTPDPGTTCAFGDATAAATTITCNDNGTFTAKLTVDDGVNPPVSDSAKVTVKNVAPTITALVPSAADVVPVGSKVGFTVSYSDPGTNDIISIAWPNNTSSGKSATYSYNASGLYTVTVTVSDDDGGADTESYRYVAVYDPARTITGDGATLSPTGAYTANPLLRGKAIFAFSVQYKKGATVPSGSLSYQVGRGFRFASTSSDWLVALGPDAKYQGSGTVNGSGDYAFMLTVHDGQAAGGGGTDQFRLKVWDKINGNVIYDNQAGVADDAWGGPPIGSGDIATTSSPIKPPKPKG